MTRKKWLFFCLISVAVRNTVNLSGVEGRKIEYDSISNLGKSDLSPTYLGHFLDLEPGDLYREKDIADIDRKLRNLPLVQVKGPSRVYFINGKARVVLQIDDRVTDRFDGIVGLAPNSNNAEDNALLITGEVNLELKNLFRSAKQFELHWRNYLQRSQKLDVSLTWPYLFNTKLGIHGAVNINKFDTLFVNLNSKIGFRYQQKGNNYLQFYYQAISSNLLTVDTALVRSTARIPDNNPFRIDNYGLNIYQSSFDYLPNPRKGYLISADISLGVKQLLRNTEVDLVQFYDPESNGYISIYDTLNKRSLRSAYQVDALLFIPVFDHVTVVNGLTFGGLFAPSILFNELYNFGGFSSLKGFDENELFASKYLLYKFEYRYLLGGNSHVGVFFNTAFIENTVEQETGISETPYGFGAIGQLDVGNGSLSLAYALGSRRGNPIAFNSAKIHFGIVNYF